MSHPRLDLIELTSRYAFAVDTFNLGAVINPLTKPQLGSVKD